MAQQEEAETAARSRVALLLWGCCQQLGFPSLCHTNGHHNGLYYPKCKVIDGFRPSLPNTLENWSLPKENGLKLTAASLVLRGMLGEAHPHKAHGASKANVSWEG